MRYKIVAFIAVLLIGTPVFAQETSPIIIKTGRPTPSVVRTGELFKVAYQAQFYDEVFILEEQMQPENIIAEPFEVINLEIVSLPDHGDDSTGIIHIKDFVYTFRIIKPEKGDKKIPPFNFIWVVKKAGIIEANAKEGNEPQEIPTEEVGVRYVYSPIKPPPLSIRDKMNFPSFKYSGATLRNYSYRTIAGSLLVSLFVIFVWVCSGIIKARKADKKILDETATGFVFEVVPSVTLKKARRRFLRDLKKLLKIKDIDVPSPELEKRVYCLLRELILVELSGIPIKASTSDTPNELYNRLKALGAKDREAMGLKYRVFTGLTFKLKNYYEDMESGPDPKSGRLTHFTEPRSEIQSLINTVKGEAFVKRLGKTLVDSFRISHV